MTYYVSSVTLKPTHSLTNRGLGLGLDNQVLDNNTAFVHPHLLFGVEMYAHTRITHLSKLVTLNNKILRILQNKTYSAPVKELYAHYNTLSVPQLHKLQLFCYWPINVLPQTFAIQNLL